MLDVLEAVGGAGIIVVLFRLLQWYEKSSCRHRKV
jgi:hypothetical protein